MNEEIIRNEELNEVEEIEIYDEPKSSKGVGGAIALGVIGLAAAGVATWWVKTKDKRKQKQLKRLRDEGYVIYDPEDVIETAEDGCDEED